MKTLLKILGIVILAMTCQSCSLDNDPQDDGNHRLHQDKTSKVYQFKLSLGGDYVEQSEEPLTRVSTSNSYVGINVTRLEKGQPTSKTEKYAYGVFSNKSEISIDLISGYRYDFKASVITDRKDEYYPTNNQYPRPFTIIDGKSDQEVGLPKDSLNKFMYTHDINHYPDESSKLHINGLNSGTAFIQVYDPIGSETGRFSYPRVERYYGELDNVDPTNLPYDEIILNLNYKCFGIKIDATDVPSGTYVTWEDITNKGNLPPKKEYEYLQHPASLKLGSDSNFTNVWEEIYSLNDLVGEGNETFTFEFTWHNGNKQEPFKQTFQVRAKYKKILKLNVTGDVSTTTKGNIIIREESNSLTDEDVITVSNSN